MSALRDALTELPEAVFGDLLDRDEAYLLVIDLPGATAETTDITAEAHRVRIETRREKDVPEDFSYLQEDRSLFLDADLPLPPDAVGEDAEATIERGVLELRIPRRTTEEGTTIPVEDV